MTSSFYFPGILVGPYLDFPEYRDLIGEVMFEDPQAKAKAKAGRKLPPGRKRVAYFKMFMGLVYLGLFVVCGGKLNYATALTPWFAGQPLIMRYLMIFHALLLSN